MSIRVLLDTLIVLFGIIAIGYFVTKRGWMNPKVNPKISELIIKLTLPALIFGSVFAEETTFSQKEVMNILRWGFALYFVLFILSFLTIYLIKPNKEDSGIYQILLIYANTGFIGYPLFGALFGAEAIFYMAVMHLPYNIFFFTIGVYIIRKSMNADKKEENVWKSIFSPGTIASLLAILFFAFNLTLPQPMIDMVITVGSATTPLALLIIGSSLTVVPFDALFKNRKLYFFTFIKLILLPLFVSLLIMPFPINDMIRIMIILSTALPSGSLVVMMASQYGDNTELASSAVFLTTVLLVLTTPLVAAIIL